MVLTDTLRTLERDSIISREEYVARFQHE
ncbi:hypothetical protein [Corynebacterium freiburgense]